MTIRRLLPRAAAAGAVLAFAAASPAPAAANSIMADYALLRQWSPNPVDGPSLIAINRRTATAYVSSSVPHHDDDGDFFGRVRSQNLKGELFAIWSVPGGIADIAVAPVSGHVYVANGTRDVYEFRADGTPIRHWDAGLFVRALAYSPRSGLLYVVENALPKAGAPAPPVQLEAFTTDGRPAGGFRLDSGNDGYTTVDIAVDPQSGDLFALRGSAGIHDNDEVRVWAPAGRVLDHWTVFGSHSSPLAVRNRHGIAVGPFGRVFVTGALDEGVDRPPASSTHVETLRWYARSGDLLPPPPGADRMSPGENFAEGTLDGKLTGIDVDSSGNFYVPNGGRNLTGQVLVFAPRQREIAAPPPEDPDPSQHDTSSGDGIPTAIATPPLLQRPNEVTGTLPTVSAPAKPALPDTGIVTAPPAVTRDRTVSFQLTALAGARFGCQLRRRGQQSRRERRVAHWHPCHARKTYHHLRPGHYVFTGRSFNAAGQSDPTPLKIRFTVQHRHGRAR